VGPLVGIAITALFLWLLYAQRQRKQNSLANQALISERYTYEQAAYAKPQLPYENTSPGTHEHPPEIHEMHANSLRQDPIELPGIEYARSR
jgi:type II secretory pathway pseudopilin PulG